MRRSIGRSVVHLSFTAEVNHLIIVPNLRLWQMGSKITLLGASFYGGRFEGKRVVVVVAVVVVVVI